VRKEEATRRKGRLVPSRSPAAACGVPSSRLGRKREGERGRRSEAEAKGIQSSPA
jgi:hypothetical protein